MNEQLSPVDQAKAKCAEVFRTLDTQPYSWSETVLSNSFEASAVTCLHEAQIKATVTKIGDYSVVLERWGCPPTTLAVGTYVRPSNVNVTGSPVTPRYEEGKLKKGQPIEAEDTWTSPVIETKGSDATPR